MRPEGLDQVYRQDIRSVTYLDFKLSNGFNVHLEGESMDTFVPSTLVGNPDTGQRELIGFEYVLRKRAGKK